MYSLQHSTGSVPSGGDSLLHHAQMRLSNASKCSKGALLALPRSEEHRRFLLLLHQEQKWRCRIGVHRDAEPAACTSKMLALRHVSAWLFASTVNPVCHQWKRNQPACYRSRLRNLNVETKKTACPNCVFNLVVTFLPQRVGTSDGRLSCLDR